MYGASSILGRLLNYLLVPFYVRVFSTAEYGIVTEIYTWVVFLNIIFTYGLETTYFRFANQDPKKYYNIAQSSVLISSVAFLAILLVFSNPIATALDYEGKGIFIRWMAFTIAIDAIVAIPFARLRKEGQAVKFASYKLLNIGLNISLNVFLIIILPKLANNHPGTVLESIYDPNIGVGYIFLANLIANAVYLILFLPLLAKMRVRIGSDWKKMMRYGLPITVIGLAGATNEMLSRLLIKYHLPKGFYEGFTNQEIIGIFGGAIKLSVFMVLAIQAFKYAFEPYFFANAENKNSPKQLSRIMHGFIIFGCLCWMAISIFLPEIAILVLDDSDYIMAIDVVPLLLGGGLFLGIYYNLSVWYKLTDKTVYGAYLALGGSAITITLNLLLIPKIGMMGSAFTTFFTYGSMMVASYILSKKYYPIPYRSRKASFYLILSMACILTFYIWDFGPMARYLTGTLLILAFIAVVWFTEIRNKKLIQL